MTRSAGILWVAVAAALLGLTAGALAGEPAQGLDQFRLERAIGAWAEEDLHRVVTELGAIDLSRESAFGEASRAAFLYGEACILLGDESAYRALAERAGDPSGDTWRRWIAWRGLTLGAAGTAPGADGAAALLAASIQIDQGRAADAARTLEQARVSRDLEALRLHLLGLASTAAGMSARDTWTKLANLEPRSDFERELVGDALLALAVDDLANGRSAREHLESVPATATARGRALHMLALTALEDGERERAIAHLDELVVRGADDALGREALLLRGSLDMDAGDFSAALSRFEDAEASLHEEQDFLQRLAEGTSSGEAWEVWDSSTVSALEPADASAAAAAAVQRALDLDDHDGDFEPVGLAEARVATSRFARHTPSADELAELADLRAARRAIEVDRAALESEIDGAASGVQRRLRYLELGTSRNRRSLGEIDVALRDLEAHLATLERTLAQMDSVQADATRRIVDRTRRVIDELDRNRLFIAALSHFYLDGPQRVDPAASRALLEAETALAGELAHLASVFGTDMAGLVDQSFDQHLEPRISTGARTLHAALLLERERAQRLFAGLDSLGTSVRVDPRLFARRDSLTNRAVELEARESELRHRIAIDVALRALGGLESEREALDYHLADAAFEHAIALALDPETSEDTDVLRPARTNAIARLDSFLARHPESFARAETRFRLADLHLLRSRDEFQARMAGYLGDDAAGASAQDRALAPFVDTTASVELYHLILDEDPGFAHRDAVLYSLGMILADDGNPEGVARLAELVERHPGSAHVQEAWLRLGGERFDAKDYARAIPSLERAVDGADPSLTAIALYKLGWSHYELDRFDAAADGFRQLMDLYATHEKLAGTTDLRDEAEEYLVHSLSRGGGADEFARYFDSIGGRDYESRILASIGGLLKGYSLYDESIACDRLWLERYPTGESALPIARRMVDSYARDGRVDEARELRLALAPRFMDGGGWYEAHPDNDEGVEFARESYREAATHWHERARASADAADWERTLALYETFLGHWPDTRMDYQAGEAAAELGHYERALEHFSVAAADTAGYALDAAWQMVAAVDGWYGSAPTDSLAMRVIAVGDAYLDRAADDDRAPDLRWRQAQLAYHHEHDNEAARRFAEMAAFHPADQRAPLGLRLRGDAFHRHGDLRSAALAYEEALDAATAAGQDSLAAILVPVIPTSWYQHAEAIAAAGSEGAAADEFAEVARRFPDYGHADQALYRAGLGYLDLDANDAAIDAFSAILKEHPDSEFARDASIRIAQTHEGDDRPEEAALAWASFSRRFPEDPDAPAALMKSVDAFATLGNASRVDALQSEFLERYPDETATVMEIREARARRELDASGIDLLAGGGSADLAAYLALAKAHPELASPAILAEVDFHRAESLREEYDRLQLTQPLDASIEAKKEALEALLDAYGECAGRQVRSWAHASAYRIGEALIGFGDALLESERPSGLDEDELLAYDEVVEEQSWTFHDRGEEAWNELLRQNPPGSTDPDGWLDRTRDELWPRVARRFLHQPAATYPLVEAEPPAGE